jgi:subtilase family serine protease
VGKAKATATILLVCSLVLLGSFLCTTLGFAADSGQGMAAQTFHVAVPAASFAVAGYSPAQIRAAYNLPSNGGEGTTIAIIDAYDAPTLQTDANIFCSQFGLPPLNSSNLIIQKMAANLASNDGWAQETTLDVEWAHAIAPQAKILVVLAETAYDTDLLDAVKFACSYSDVVAVSMSWDTPKLASAFLDSYFHRSYGAVFFAAREYDGAGVCGLQQHKRVVSAEPRLR